MTTEYSEPQPGDSVPLEGAVLGFTSHEFAEFTLEDGSAISLAKYQVIAFGSFVDPSNPDRRQTIIIQVPTGSPKEFKWGVKETLDQVKERLC